ncbi:MAG: TPM domain-containing protein [Myxococcota bacterium]|jgi:uncharacterized protein|nr:TPM domain-containing protein [Myxococcota bacterium]
MKRPLCLAFGLILGSLILSQAQAQEIPKLTGPVMDLAGLLEPSSKNLLAASLQRYRQEHGAQIQVLTVESLGGASVEGYSIRVAEKWQLGDKGKNNGVLLLIAAKDRKWRIEVGADLEGDLTDLAASRIGREILVPAFKQGLYAQGIQQTLQAIAQKIGPELTLAGPLKGTPRRARRGSSGGSIVLLLMMLFFLFSGRGGSFFSGFLLANLLGSGYSRSSGGSFGGGFSGGGWSGGGGSFSGGGASGGW